MAFICSCSGDDDVVVIVMMSDDDHDHVMMRRCEKIYIRRIEKYQTTNAQSMDCDDWTQI